MNRFARFILRRAGWVALFGSLLGVVGSYYSVLLYKNLRTDLEELLPTTARSVLDMNEVTDRLLAIDNIVILIFTQHDLAAAKRFQIDLATALEKTPKNVIAGVEYKIDREIRFFKDRQSLYIGVPDLNRIKSFIGDRINYEKQLYNPLTILENRDLPEPKLDFEGMKQKYSAKTNGFDRFPDGYYAMPDQKLRVIVANMPGKASEIASAIRLKEAVLAAVTKLNPKSYSPDLEIKYTGNVQNLIEENNAVMADLELSTVVVALLVTLIMILFYRSVPATMCLVWSVFMGTFWTFGVSFFTVGYLNANSAFMASIVLGNGINFGIVFLARYMEERRKNKSGPHACYIAITRSATATWTAALAAGLSYGSLMLTAFRGFRQFGLIGLVGMILCWISAYTLLPAYLTLWDRYCRPIQAKKHKAHGRSLPNLIAATVERWPRAIWGASLVALVLSFFAIPNIRHGVIEMDLNKLRDKECMEHGSGSLYHYIHDVFQRHLSPIVILPRSRDDTRKVAESLRAQKEKDGPDGMIAEIQTLDDFIPPDQAHKIVALHGIQRELPHRLMTRLPEGERKLAGELLSSRSLKPFSEKDLPGLVLSKFTEKDGSIGKMILVDNVEGRGADNAEELIAFVKELRDATDAVAPGTPVAGALPISSDMVAAIVHDGPIATAVAFAAVIVLVILLFRNARTVALCLFALSVGVTWLSGIILHYHLKINFLNFVALPITFGIGVDYGVNIFQRYREEGRGSIGNVIRHTGGAVMLASATTVIGYGSLLLAGNQAFVSFGRLAALGELTCITAAVISLPAFLHTLDRRKKKDLLQNAA